PNGRTLAVAVAGSPRVRLYTVTNGGLRTGRLLTVGLDAARTIAWLGFAPDGRRLLAVSQYGGWVIWSTPSGHPVSAIAPEAIGPLRHAPGKVVAATLSPDGLVGIAVNEGKVVLRGRVWVYEARGKKAGRQEHAPWLGLPVSTLAP